jgi:D-3-phosphoglycerate dehydrogenase
MTMDIIKEAPCLLSIGCFCIGTNQVDLEAALSKGISVFNSPFSNSRSVAELIIGEIITLARQLGDRNTEMHSGKWNKRSAGCFEIRGKVLGIVGYGHIGSQLSVLAEAMGMRVIFYDVAQIMPLGSAMQMRSLSELLRGADFVTLHVPELPSTMEMIGERELSLMKPGSFLLNASRGRVVQLDALKGALRSGRLAGAALDVYPVEPESNGDFWADRDLAALSNVLLTPHIGGSTEEAQAAIGSEVASAMVKFLNSGSSTGSVNFPEVDLKAARMPDGQRGFLCRLLNVHHNVPGVLKKINLILAEHNIEKQTCESKGPFSYVIVDVSTTEADDLDRIFKDIYDLPESVATRLLY